MYKVKFGGKKGKTFQLVESPDLVAIRTKDNQKLEDVEQWFYSTEWSTTDEVSSKMLMNVVHTLTYANIIDKKVSVEDLCFRV